MPKVAEKRGRRIGVTLMGWRNRGRNRGSRVPGSSRLYSKVLPAVILIMGVLTAFVVLVAIAAFVGIFP